jgi:mono/diheme cytochrome c family protein
MRIVALIAIAASIVLGTVVFMSAKDRPEAAVEKRPQRALTQADRGRDLFQYWCATCHGAGVGAEGRSQLPGTAALQEKYGGNPPALLEERTDLTPETVSYFVRNGISVMPFFRKTEISDEDLAAISAYLTRPRPAPAK